MTQMKAKRPALTIPSLTLHDGVEIPLLGLCVSRLPSEETQSAVEHALEIGYRHIDTAASPRIEAAVGAAIAISGLAREDVFVTTRLSNVHQGIDSTFKAFEEALARLGSDYVDLHMIHRPALGDGGLLETWRASERILEEGRARTIGVSNLRIEDLERLEAETDTRPTVHRVELHSLSQQVELRRWHAEHRIAVEAWSPLAQGELIADLQLGAISTPVIKVAAPDTDCWEWSPN